MIKNMEFHSQNRPEEHLKYYQWEPADNKEPLPLIIYIHGAGSRGNKLSQLNTDVGPLGEIKKGRKINSVIVSPQCHCDTWFELFDVLLEFIDFSRNQPQIDKNRVYLCGVSMGGYAAWQVAMSRPNWFSALVTVCGGGMYWNASQLKEMPVWSFHGALDDTVLPEESIHMVSAVNRAGGNAKITIYPDVSHNSWEKAFSEDELWNWMFEQRRKILNAF